MQKSRIGLLAAMLMGSLAMASPIQDGPRQGPSPRRGLRGAFKPQAATPTRSRPKRYPQMVTSSDEAIALHNATASTRQVRRAYIVRQDRALRRTVIANAGGIRQYKLQRRARQAD